MARRGGSTVFISEENQHWTRRRRQEMAGEAEFLEAVGAAAFLATEPHVALGAKR